MELNKELEKRNKIRDWEAKRDDLNEKLDSCQDKLRLVKRDDKPRDLKVDEDLLAAAKVNVKYKTQFLLISFLMPSQGL